jgi:putative ABC transport system substrate-binding protein
MDRPLRLIAGNPLDQLARTIEALLVIASAPLSVQELADAADDHPERVETALGLVADRYQECRRGIVLEHVACGWAFRRVLPGATQSIPIIFAVAVDPVELGLVPSFNRPGGNLTGIAGLITETATKRLELLHKAVPATQSIALLAGFQAETRYMQSAARTLGLRLQVINVTPDTEIAPIFATLAEQQIGAVVVGASLTLLAKLDQILLLAARFALPTMFPAVPAVRAGGLLSYGPDFSDVIRLCGAYTGRILKGEKPGDLPVVQPTKFEFVINLRTAKALGFQIPADVLALADEVIE